MNDILYRCPDGHDVGFKVDTVVQAIEYMNEYGEVEDQRLFDSEIVGPVVCLVCGKKAKEEE